MTVAKRSIDLVLATAALVVLAPLLLLVGLAICASSPGPPVFRQRRCGRNGREFVIWKFRTMVAEAEQLRAQLMAESRDADWLDLADDPRVTPLGRVLRRTSLDELPQLVNVVRGQMSLVGPRPLPLDEDARVPGWAWERYAVRPGITGLWQVSGRMTISFYDMLTIDCEYARAPSVWTDLKIMVSTVPALFTAKGAD